MWSRAGDAGGSAGAFAPPRNPCILRSFRAIPWGERHRVERFVVLGLAGLIALCLGLGALAWALAGGAVGDAEAEAPPTSGMALLQAYRCHRAETKHIVVRGVEDGFSPQGHEPIRIHPRIATPRLISMAVGGSYDNSQMDRFVIDYFELPSNVSRGLFVVGLRANGANDNDSIQIGDLGTMLSVDEEPRIFQELVPRLASADGWQKHGDLHYAEFDAIRFRRSATTLRRGPSFRPAAGPVRTLLDYVRAGEAPRVVDVQIADDTSVDFMAVAYCQEPPRGTGVTLTTHGLGGEPIPGIVIFACTVGPNDQHVCDPYVGDTACETPLPIICFRAMDAPVPRNLPANHHLHWSGGAVATTGPVPASRFATIGDVDRFCAAQFGPDWRTATYHDGGRPGLFSGFGRLDESLERAWIDIRGQPYATCWAH